MSKSKSKTIAGTTLLSIDSIGRAQVIYAVFGISFPTGIGLLTMISGIVQHMPSMWVFMAVPVSFMCTLGAVYIGYMMYNIMTPQNKLRYLQTMVPMDLEPEISIAVTEGRNRLPASLEANENHKKVARIQFGVSLQNVSHFPISAFVEHADTSVGDIRPPRFDYPSSPVEIKPGGWIYMIDQPIELQATSCGGMIESKMFIKIRYGESKHEKYELLFNAKVQVSTREDGLIQTVNTAWEPIS